VLAKICKVCLLSYVVTIMYVACPGLPEFGISLDKGDVRLEMSELDPELMEFNPRAECKCRAFHLKRGRTLCHCFLFDYHL
jgi:hypothetical protein